MTASPTTAGLRSICALIAISVAVAGLVTFHPTSAHAATTTTVSLTFDDANADQFAAAQKLRSRGMAGTFYLNSGFINQPNYLTLAQVQSMRADGHEIAGHTISHADLTAVSLDEAKRQICNDRVNWANWGMPVASFAYPFASANAAVEQAARDCGYNSARGLGDVRSPRGCPPAPDWCPTAVGEAIPPADPFYTKAPDQVETTWTLADLRRSVTQAESSTRTATWVQLTFHHICTSATSCQAPGISATIFNQFVDWLATRPATTVVKTVGAVIGGTTKPAVPGPVLVPSTTIKNANLETFNSATGLPQCFMAGGYGTNTATFTTTTTGGHAGSRTAVRIAMSNYANGDAKLLPTLDLGECAPAVTPGETLTIGQWYTSTTVTQFALYYRLAGGSWVYWTSSPWFAAAPAWAQATWQTPAVPAGATAVSFGLNLFNNGTLTVDDFSMTRGSATQVASASGRSSLQASEATRTVRAPAVQSLSPTRKGDVVRRTKGDVVRELNVVPAPLNPKQSRRGRPAAGGIAPGDAALQPFVVSPELTKG